MLPARLPIPAAPARYETLASYLSRLATLHGMPTRKLWEPISTPRPGTKRRDVLPDALAALVGRTRDHLARALPELRDPASDWTAWRHQSQPGCPRCDARHDGGPVARLLPHHRYVCTEHRYWIGPPDAGQSATKLEPDPVEADEIVRAGHRHQRLLHRHGSAATFDAVLTGFLICGHLWNDHVGHWDQAVARWDRRAAVLIPNAATAQFSASRIFAAVYPEAVETAALIAAPSWRQLATGTKEQQQQFIREIGARLGQPDYLPPEHGDAIAHWMKFDSWRPPSDPETTFPQTHEYGAMRPAKTRPNSIERNHRSAIWFRGQTPRRRRHPSSPARSLGPQARLVTADGWHPGDHLGKPHHNVLSLRPAATHDGLSQREHPRRRNCNLKLDDFGPGVQTNLAKARNNGLRTAIFSWTGQGVSDASERGPRGSG